MLRGRTAGIAAALAIAATAAVTAGCGGGGSTRGAALRLDPVSAAATKTQDAGTARIRLAIGLGHRGKSLRLRGTGAIDGSSAELNLKLASMFGAMGLPAETGGATMAQLQHATLKEIVLEQDGDYVIYLRLPAFLSSRLPGGKQWIKLDLTKLGKSAGVDLGQLMSGGQLEPSDLLSMLETDGAKVQKLGAATIDGVATTRYHVKIDLAKALRSEGVKSPLLSGVAAKTKTVSDDVWIGKDGLVRRVQLRYSVPKGATPTHLGMTMDLYDYGADVSITAPPSSAVFDATQFAQQGLGSLH